MDLNRKYRPIKFSQIIGQKSVVESMKSSMGSSQSFIFHGPSGVGKTTLARVCATELGQTELFEYDAASNSGVSEMREIILKQNYFPLNNGSRVFIIDECQRLSKNAWDVLLKAIEEPQEKNYWFFCTTEYNKIPVTIKTRCFEFNLKKVDSKTIKSHLQYICKEESFDVTEDLIDLISNNSNGSPRKSLILLQQSIGLNIDQAKEIISNESDIPNAFSLARHLSKSTFNLEGSMSLCKLLKGENPEGVRQVVRSYFTTVCLSNPNNRWAKTVLHEFESPSREQNKITDIMMRVFNLDKWRDRVEY